MKERLVAESWALTSRVEGKAVKCKSRLMYLIGVDAKMKTRIAGFFSRISRYVAGVAFTFVAASCTSIPDDDMTYGLDGEREYLAALQLIEDDPVFAGRDFCNLSYSYESNYSRKLFQSAMEDYETEGESISVEDAFEREVEHLFTSMTGNFEGASEVNTLLRAGKEKGHIKSAHFLACFNLSFQTRTNAQFSIDNFRWAAGRGLPDSAVMLAKMYGTGHYAPFSIVRSIYWLKKAIELSNDDIELWKISQIKREIDELNKETDNPVSKVTENDFQRVARLAEEKCITVGTGVDGICHWNLANALVSDAPQDASVAKRADDLRRQAAAYRVRLNFDLAQLYAREGLNDDALIYFEKFMTLAHTSEYQSLITDSDQTVKDSLASELRIAGTKAASIYLLRPSSSDNDQKVIEHYKIADRYGAPDAAYHIGSLLHQGDSAEIKGEAATWYKKGALAGHSESQRMFAVSEANIGRRQSFERWILAASEQNNHLAQMVYAMYLVGKIKELNLSPVETSDPCLAVRLFLSAAAQEDISKFMVANGQLYYATLSGQEKAILDKLLPLDEAQSPEDMDFSKSICPKPLEVVRAGESIRRRITLP